MFKYTWVDMGCDLTNKVIAITDASSGIRPATVVACARAGMDVSLQARRAERLLKVAAQVKKAGLAVVTAFPIFNATLMRKRYSNIKPRYAMP